MLACHCNLNLLETSHIWIITNKTLGFSPWSLFFYLPSCPGAHLHVNGGISFILEKHTGNRVYSRIIDSDQCALTLVSSRRLGGALCVEKWTCLEPFSSYYFFIYFCDLDYYFFAGKLDLLWPPGNILFFFLSRLFRATEWCRIECGIKLGLRAACMARQVFQSTRSGAFFLSWCKRPRWEHLEQHGGKEDCLLLSSGDAVLPVFLSGPPNR